MLYSSHGTTLPCFEKGITPRREERQPLLRLSDGLSLPQRHGETYRLSPNNCNSSCPPNPQFHHWDFSSPNSLGGTSAMLRAKNYFTIGFLVMLGFLHKILKKNAKKKTGEQTIHDLISRFNPPNCDTDMLIYQHTQM